MKKKFRSFKNARTFARTLSIRSGSEWKKLAVSNQLPDDIPHDPAKSYKNKGWNGWSDWLGTGNIPNKDRKYWKYDNAIKYVRKLNLKNQNDWTDYRKSGKLPSYIPSAPWRVYENNGWIGLWHWLGKDKPRTFGIKYLTYEQAKEIVKKFNLTGKDKWAKFVKLKKLPSKIPSTPERYYKNTGWISWGDWLGTGRIANQDRKYWSFEKSRDQIRKLNLHGRKEFLKLYNKRKIPTEIPRTPAHVYKNSGWVSWGDFVGTGWIHPITKSKNRLNFVDARKEAQLLAKKYNLKTFDDWIKAVQVGKIPSYLPQRPDKIYAKKKSTETNITSLISE